MKISHYFCFGGFLLLCVNIAFAKEENSFSYKDWAITCDNTRTCRAEGYQLESYDEFTKESNPISMLITRSAGPNTLVDIRIQVSSEIDSETNYVPSNKWSFYIGNLELSGKPDVKSLTWHLSALQVKQLLPELLRQSSATLVDGNLSWHLSVVGAKAMLLKMDDKQGRLSTPGALVKRGSRDENQVLKPLVAPKLYAVALEKQRPNDKKLGKLMLAEINKDDYLDCNDVYEHKLPSPIIYRLTNSKVLMSIECPTGAYNYTSLLWIADDKPPYQPKLQEANGDFDNGAVQESFKGRGIGDCWSSRTWYFDGNKFVTTGESTSGMCRGFVGGAWNVPTYVSKVIKKR